MGIEDFLPGAEVRRGIAMARKTPAHMKRLCLPGHRHVADRAMACRASDALGDMDAMIEVNVIGQCVDARPADRNILSQALTVWREHRSVRPDLRVASHADCGGGHSRIRGFLDHRVTVAAVEPQSADMVLVAEWDRLFRSEPLFGIVSNDGHDPDRQQQENAARKRSKERRVHQHVRLRREDCHWCTPAALQPEDTGSMLGLPPHNSIGVGLFPARLYLLRRAQFEGQCRLQAALNRSQDAGLSWAVAETCRTANRLEASATGRGGEILKFPGYTIEPILGRHAEPPANIVGPIDAALKQVTKPLTEEEAAEQSIIRQRATSDRRVIAEGTIAYLITLDDGFRIMYRDSGGRITEWEKTVMERIGRVDLALIAVAASYLNTLTVEQAIEHIRTYKPDVYMPAHHDSPNNGLWRAIEPISEAIKGENPNIITVSREYRTPVCFNTDFDIQRGR